MSGIVRPGLEQIDQSGATDGQAAVWDAANGVWKPGASGVPATRAINTDSTLTGGGDLSADRTLGVETTSEAERIRDVIGAALVQGGTVTITVNDAGDTITISGSEYLMADGVTSPPVPIETEAGDDWLYQD